MRGRHFRKAWVIAVAVVLVGAQVDCQLLLDTDPEPGADARDSGDAPSDATIEGPATKLSAPRVVFVRRGKPTQPGTTVVTVSYEGNRSGTLRISGLPSGLTADEVAASPGSVSIPIHATHDAALTAEAVVAEVSLASEGASLAATALRVYVADEPGVLDTTFGDAGLAAVGCGDSARSCNGAGMVLDDAGNAIVGGWMYPADDSGVTAPVATRVRVGAAGALDTSFGDNGVFRVPFAASAAATAAAIALDADGRILLGGYATSRSFVARLTPGGALDTTFGAAPGGFAYVNGVQAVRLATDTNAVFVGHGLSVTRLTPSGEPPLNWNGGSPHALPFAEPSQLQCLLARSGDVWAEGHAAIDGGTAVFIALLGDSGAPVTEFGTGETPGMTLERVPSPSASFSSGCLLDQAGLLYAMSTNLRGVAGDIAIHRFLPNGRVDTSFADGGRATFPNATTSDCYRPRALVADEGGRLVVVADVALTASDSSRSIVVARFDGNGAPDVGFGARGGLTTALDFAKPVTARALALDPDGRILVLGVSGSADDAQTVIARYWP